MRQAGEELKLENVPEETHGDRPYQNRERLASESSISKQVRSHRRAMSDPFDTAEMAGITDGIDQPYEDYALAEEEAHALPTLQRYPFAENNNKNCWSEPPVDIFKVRGPNYLNDKKKVTANRYLLRPRGCDLFLSDNPNDCELSR